MKTEKPKGKDEELRMPADAFDRIMGQVMGPPDEKKKKGAFRDSRDREVKPPPQLGDNPIYTDVPKYDPDKKPPKPSQPPKK